MSILSAQEPRPGARGFSVHLGATSIVEWMPAQRSSTPAPRLDAERVHLHIVTHGVFTRTDRGTDDAVAWALHEGHAFFTIGAAPLMVQGSRESRLTTVSVPHEAFPYRSTEGLTRVRTDSGLLAPVCGFVAQARMVETTELTSVARYYLERLLQEMVVALSVDLDRTDGVPRGRDVFSRALSLVVAQCTDPDLSASAIARDMSLSLRQLERIFSDRGTTIGAAVRTARVDHAMSLLRRAEYDALTIDQVAVYSGFSNGSSLARAMRAEGRPSPARVRSRR